MQTLPLVTILLLSLSSNLDNIGIGVSYGIRKVTIPFSSNLLIALVTSCGTLLSILLGRTIYAFVSPGAASLFGGLIIVAAGVWVMVQQAMIQRAEKPNRAKPEPAKTRPEVSRSRIGHLLDILNNPILADRDSSGDIDLREAAALAFGLTINNIPNGVGAGMLGLSPALMTPVVFMVSIITIWSGMSFGYLGYRHLGKSAGWVSGVVLILIGVFETFHH